MIKSEVDFRKDFRHARKIIDNSGPTVFVTGKYDLDKFYWCNTQNLNYISDLTKNKEVKNAFTITGSADNIFELVLAGADNIIATDTNPYAKYVYELKKAALKTLNAKEYLEFIMDHQSNNFLSSKTFYDKVIHGFEDDENLAKFWEKLFSYYTNKEILYRLFKPIFRYMKAEDRKLYSTYIQNKKYLNTQERMDNVNIDVYEEDALSLLQKMDQTYDWIDITNILLFVMQFSMNEDISEFDKYISDLAVVIKEKLADEGIFLSDYMFKVNNPKLFLEYDTNKGTQNLNDRIKWINAVIQQHLNQYFDQEYLRYKAIPSTANNTVENGVGDYLVLSKVRK